MLVKKYFWPGLVAAMSCSNISFAADLDSALDEVTVSGNFRAYYNTRDFESPRTDTSAFAVGGALRAETGALGAFKFGLGYYTAQDLDTNSSNPDKVLGSLGSELEVLAEAYVTAGLTDTTVTLGRQKISTPFANTGDAFIIPFTFEGVSIKNTSIDNLTIELDHINAIKNRNSHDFVDVGVFATSRLGVAATGTSGTTMLGATYAPDSLKLQGWLYEYADLFRTAYLQANYSFAGSDTIKPFVAAQYITQSESGDELLGTVDSTLMGLQAGAKMGKATLTLAYNTVADEADAFKNGAFLTPYTFSTSPVFTNNMLTTFDNADAGDAMKLTFNYAFPKTTLKVSYADFDYDLADDKEAIDLDVTYTVSKGFTLRWRFETVISDNSAAEQVNHRFQLQKTF